MPTVLNSIENNVPLNDIDPMFLSSLGQPILWSQCQLPVGDFLTGCNRTIILNSSLSVLLETVKFQVSHNKMGMN